VSIFSRRGAEGPDRAAVGAGEPASLLMAGAAARVFGALVLIAALWLAVAWALR
jgi:hypothetical protein